jgi:WD40 repeat protein
LVSAGKTLILSAAYKETSPTLPVLDYLPVSLPNTVTQAMASTLSTQPAAAPKMILPPVMTLEGHEYEIRSICYSPDGKQMVSGGLDKTTQRWNLQAGKEVEDVRDVWERICAMAISRDGRWLITAGGDLNLGRWELKACEIKTGMVKRFEGHSLELIECIDISKDSMLLASASHISTVRIWSLDTGKLVAGPFMGRSSVGAIRFSQDSKKLAINSLLGWLEVWDVQTQKLHQRAGKSLSGRGTYAPIFWTNKETILAVFPFDEVVHERGDASATTIYEFDASTLETLGAPFEGHIDVIYGLALSFDGALLASTSGDNTIKLWAFESRQLLASFHVLHPCILTLSPNSRQLAYTTRLTNKIFICNTPPDVLASIGLAPEDNVRISCIYLSFMW